MASSAAESGEVTSENGRCETAERATAPTPRCTGPTSSPSSIEPTRNAPPARNGTAERAGRKARVAPPSRAGSDSTAVIYLALSASGRKGLGFLTGHVRSPW